MPRAYTPEEKKEKYENRPEQTNRSGRPQRNSINGVRNKLTVAGQEPGWHYCWVNEYNVDRFLSAAYEFVTHDVRVGDTKIDNASQMGSKISLPGGNGYLIYLMRVQDEYYREDMEELNKAANEAEAQLKTGLSNKDDGRYGQAVITQDPRRIM